MNRDFQNEEILVVPAGMDRFKIPKSFIPNIKRYKVSFKSKLPIYILNAIRSIIISSLKVKHLRIDCDSYTCSDHSVIYPFIDINIDKIMCRDVAKVGSQYVYEVNSTDSYMFLAAREFKPLLESGAQKDMINYSTIFGYLFPNCYIKFIATVVEETPKDCGLTLTETNIVIISDEEEKLIREHIQEPNYLYNIRHELKNDEHNFRFVNNGYDTYQNILGKAKTFMLDRLRSYIVLLDDKNFIPLKMVDKNKIAYIWELPGANSHVSYALQYYMIVDKKFLNCSLENDYVNEKMVFNIYMDCNKAEMIAEVGKKINGLIKMMEDFNIS